MLAQSPTWLDLIPGARAGVSYLMGQVARFNLVPRRIVAVETGAVQVKRAAESRGDLGSATKMALVLQATSSIRDRYNGTAARLADVIEGLRTSGFAQVSTDLALSAAQVAAEMATIFSLTDAAQASVYDTGRKVLTPAEYARLQVVAPLGGGALAQVGDYGKYALLLAGAYVGVVVLMKKGKRRAA